jgi:putative acetyltransferase
MVSPICADVREVAVCDTRGVIRAYTDDDLSGVLDAWNRASLEAHPFLSEDFFDTEREAISNEWLPASETSVFEIGGHVVGFVSMVGNEVGGIFVAPRYQKRGVGRALMDHAAATRPYLELEVFRANTIGRGFYEAYGFRVVGEGLDDTTGLPVLRLRLDRPKRSRRKSP